MIYSDSGTGMGTILIVDDVEINRAILEEIIRSMNRNRVSRERRTGIGNHQRPAAKVNIARHFHAGHEWI